MGFSALSNSMVLFAGPNEVVVPPLYGPKSQLDTTELFSESDLKTAVFRNPYYISTWTYIILVWDNYTL